MDSGRIRRPGCARHNLRSPDGLELPRARRRTRWPFRAAIPLSTTRPAATAAGPGSSCSAEGIDRCDDGGGPSLPLAREGWGEGTSAMGQSPRGESPHPALRHSLGVF
ncbi:hypothetical protein XH96_31450 [Bradyrhizobium sp. CCBAU 51765]|nr:hypothetical protein XH96_31450 [Bradyrhizobium sp. CCBAU 51765]